MSMSSSRRTLAVVGATVALVVASLLTAAGSAHAAEVCRSFTHRYFLGAGSAIEIRVGFVDTVLNVCQDDTGAITSATVSQTTGTTGPGSAAGFTIDAGAASVINRTAGHLNARYAGRMRVCVAGRTPLCDRSYDYEIGVGYPFIGPTQGDPNVPTWTHGPETPGGVHYYESA